MLIGLLSDAHGNLEAFELALAVLARRDAESIYFLGDAVGYLPGSGVADHLVASGMPAVMGNHEAMLLAAGPESSDLYRLAETRRGMSEETLAGIGAWPVQREFEAACGRVRLMHGSPSDPVYGYVYPDTDLSAFETQRGDTIFLANTHRPFVRPAGDALFVNIGSCGLPRDCGNLGSACVFDDRTGAVTILRFDIGEASAGALRRVGDVAAEVTAVFDRRSSDGFVGEVVDA